MSLSGAELSPLAFPLALEESLRGTSGQLTLSQVVANAAGEALSAVAVYPLALVVTRLQVQGLKKHKSVVDHEQEDSDQVPARTTHRDENGVDRDRGILAIVRDVYSKEDGVRGLYAGTLEAAAKAAADTLIRVLAYVFLRQRLMKLRGQKPYEQLTAVGQCTVGTLAEALAVVLTTPIATIVTRKQTRALSKKRDGLTTSEIVSHILSEEGPKGLWAGYLVSLISTLNLPLTVLLHQTLKRFLLQSRKSNNTSAAALYLLWGISHAASSSVTYPLSVLRTRAQATPLLSLPRASAKPEMLRFSPSVGGTHELAQYSGADTMYAGLTAEVLRISASHATAAVFNYLVTLPACHLYPSFDWSERLAKADRLGRISVSGEQGVMGPTMGSYVGSNTTQTRKSPGREHMNATAELVGDYVEDEVEDWQGFYRWFWDPERRRNGD